MRILLLTILFVAPVYYYQTRDNTPVPEIDSIKVKASAPDRVERILTVDNPVLNQEESSSTEVSASDGDQESEEEVTDEESSENSREPAVESVQLNDLEEGWNNELKNMLLRLEPADGEDIHKTYLDEQDSYQAQLDALMNEKHQKTSEEAAAEIDQLIYQLDQKHQDRMKEILGAHYEAVRDYYEEYMDSVRPEE